MIALVYGGSGALGGSIVKHFLGQKSQVISVDGRVNKDATYNVVLDLSATWQQQSEQVHLRVKEILSAGQKLDCLICVAGGWAGGNAAEKNLVGSCEMMWKQSVQSSIIVAQLASEHLKETGLVVLTGAKAANEGTSGMIGYGMAKAAVHHLTKSLAAKGSGLPEGSHVVCIQPVTLDTPGNRAAMPKADTSSWTPCETLAAKLFEWTTTAPKSNFVHVVTSKNATSFE